MSNCKECIWKNMCSPIWGTLLTLIILAGLFKEAYNVNSLIHIYLCLIIQLTKLFTEPIKQNSRKNPFPRIKLRVHSLENPFFAPPDNMTNQFWTWWGAFSVICTQTCTCEEKMTTKPWFKIKIITSKSSVLEFSMDKRTVYN